MTSFALYDSCEEEFAVTRKILVDRIASLVRPARIYLLGLQLNRRKAACIFQPPVTAAQYVSGCFLLVLMNESLKSEQQQWQEKIESSVKAIVPTTTIVLSLHEYEQWLEDKQRFAIGVCQSGVLIYGEEPGDAPPYGRMDASEAVGKHIERGLIRAQAFLSGSELFRVQRYHSLSAFMLHQSAEHALHALIRNGMGYYASTHNIDRLVNYAGFLFPQVGDIFCKNTEEQKRLFMLLQQAYIDARYSDSYKINNSDLLSITEKVRLLHAILSGLRMQHLPLQDQSCG